MPRKVTYDPDVRLESVTFEGDIYDLSGTLSGVHYSNTGLNHKAPTTYEYGQRTTCGCRQPASGQATTYECGQPATYECGQPAICVDAAEY